MYMWMYEDAGSGWGHRHAILWYPYNDNSGSPGSEGFFGIGRASGGPYQGPFPDAWPCAEIIVMNVFDPCATWGSNPDGDNIPDDEDNCPSYYNPNQEDSYPPQENGIGDACECEGNFNCSADQDVDGSDAATFKADFGRSSFKRPCIADDTCNGDFSCDGDVDGTDAALFKQDFGRSQFSNPCPACVAGVEWCVY
jgi:hypothetical protein